MCISFHRAYNLVSYYLNLLAYLLEHHGGIKMGSSSSATADEEETFF
jgi:hypothetical protein